MLDRLFGPRVTVHVVVTGIAGGHMVRYKGEISLSGVVTVQRVLRTAGSKARLDLLAAIEKGEQPVLLLDGRRLDLQTDLEVRVDDGAELSWLLPMAGG